MVYTTNTTWKYLSIFLGMLLLQKGSVFGDVEISPVNPNILENDSLTLTCTLTRTTETATSFSWYLKRSLENASVEVGILRSSCEVFGSINTTVYDYACPNSRQSTWTIKKVTQQNHRDSYVCNIETSSGYQYSGYTFLNVQALIVPSTLVVTLRENVSEEFKCKASGGLPAATITWYKNSGAPGTSNDDVEIISSIETSSSTVNDLMEVTSTLTYSPSRNDNGLRIYCTASNINGQTPTVSLRKPQLNVQYPPDGLPIITGFADDGEYRVIEGTQGKLSCSISGGNPAPTLTWDCMNSGSPQITSSGTVTKLHSWMAERGQDKTCICQAFQYSGNKTVSVRIKIMYPPTKPIFEIKSTIVSGSIKIIRQNSLSVTCSSKGQPAPSYRWAFPNMATSNGSQLNVINVQNDSRYTCSVQNIMNPSVGSTVLGSNSSFIDTLILYPPVIGELKNISVAEGLPSTISCPITVGNPPQTSYEWSKNGQVWKTAREFTINTTSRNDAMFYTCKAANIMQQTGEQPVSQPDTKSFYLNVWYRTSVTSFIIEGHEGQTNLTVPEHHKNVQFICSVDGNPASAVKIMFDGKVLKEGSNSKALTFTRSDVACFDSGVYTCEGNNNYGPPSSKDVMLFVTCFPRPLNKMKQNITSFLHVPVTLQFITLAYPPPGSGGFAWHKQNGEWWTPILSNADLQISSSELQSNLTILNVSNEDFGRYRLTVTTSIGSYIQYLFLTEQRTLQTSTNKVETATDSSSSTSSSSTPATIGSSLGIACVLLAVYAVSVTIYYKRKSTRKDVQPPDKSADQMTYVNFKSDVTENEDLKDERGGNNIDEANCRDDTVAHYTSLDQYSRDERTTYETLELT